ncbi:nucleoside triphosphate pyrophosphohydrolase family protein [Candidatus Saccharibacteria bacterium]|nr:nucleoside triphosphate pyrophosphohydrolase family protein [Candidatus Saccharibacteria bacterium]
MNLNEYSKKALTTLSDNYAHGDISAQMMGQVLGLSDESGEVLGKFKKLLRDKQGVLEDNDKKEIMKELGDVLWYVNSVAHLLGYTLDDVAQSNIDKLASRKERGTLQGSGDNR